ncbi:polymorphic toxin-type HINT domain-containing protein [Streptomyces sp. NPDC059629]|uniref:polymorphic toxin-type HINT domain-containing protein n=1 Tax=Streptomyces sp. NPDC059629 TaxID=3346889 RepID=UPI0036ACC208
MRFGGGVLARGAEQAAVKTAEKTVAKTAAKAVEKKVVKSAEEKAAKAVEKKAVKSAEKSAAKTAEKDAGKTAEKDAGKASDEGEDAVESSGKCNSFTPDTRVLLADGRTKAIKDLKPGDKVKSTDPVLGGLGTQTVTATIQGHGTKHLVRLILSNGKSITATDGHPIWLPKLHRWAKAKELRSGDWLQTSAGTYIQITAVRAWTQTATVNNLTVSSTHTYYVLAGTTAVLVHNCDSDKFDGGIYGRMQPAGDGYQINHMPQNASTPITPYSGPAIRMEKADHRQVYSTGQGNRPEPKEWLNMQKSLVASGRIDRAMMNDINDVVSRFPGKYNNAIGEMIGGLAENEQYQALRGVPEMVHVQLALW